MKIKIGLKSANIGVRYQVVELGSVVIGRSFKSDLLVEDVTVSRRHARLYRSKGVLMLEDLGSSSGTWVDDERISGAVAVGPGTVIRLGSNRADGEKPGCEITLSSSDSVAEENRKVTSTQEQTFFKDAVSLLADNTSWNDDVEPLENYTHRLEMLQELQEALARSSNQDQLVEIVLERLFQLFHPEQATVFLRQADGSFEVAGTRSESGDKDKPFLSETLLHEMTAKGMAILARDTSQDQRFAAALSIRAAGIRSLIASPLFEANQIYGMVVVTSGASRLFFGEKDMGLLVCLASLTTLRICNFMLARANARQLEERNRLLEEMVEERTRELSRRNQELEQKNQEIARSQDQLVISEKMAALGKLTGGVAHEINNPNNFILVGAGNLDAWSASFRDLLFSLLDEGSDELREVFESRFKNHEKQLKAIREGSDRITTIVKSLRLVSQHADIKDLKSMDLLEVLRAAVLLKVSTYKAWVDIELNCGGFLMMNCRPSQLSLVFLNMIDNGCRAIKALVEKDPGAQPGKLTISCFPKDGEAILTFKDEGIGMSDSFLKKVFDPFFTTRPPGMGTGLGLYVCYSIIEKHFGRISVTSREGEGSVFTLWLPLAEQKQDMVNTD